MSIVLVSLTLVSIAWITYGLYRWWRGNWTPQTVLGSVMLLAGAEYLLLSRGIEASLGISGSSVGDAILGMALLAIGLGLLVIERGKSSQSDSDVAAQ